MGRSWGDATDPEAVQISGGLQANQYPEVFEESSHMTELSLDKDLHENANENHSEVQWPPIKLTKKSTSGKCWRGCGEKGPFYTVDENVNQCSHYGEHSGGSLKKTKIESPYDPAIPLLGIYPKKALIQKDTCSPMFIATLFTIAKMWKQPKRLSIDQFSSIAQLCPTLCNPMNCSTPGLCPSPTPRVHSNSCPSSW